MTTTYTYKQISDLELKADLYPANKENAPLILYIHGGGLIWGSRTDINKEQVALFNQHGYHVLSVSYRLAPESKLPDIAEDIRDAIIWTRENLSFNDKKLIVMGNSAGGYLSLLSGTFETKPAAIVSFYGYGNILADWYNTPSSHFNAMTKVNETLAKQLIRNKEITDAPITTRYAIYLYCRQQGVWPQFVSEPGVDLKAFCPANLIDKTYPPTLLLHGDKDEDVPYSESVNMQKALNKWNVKNKLITIPNGKHQFDENMNDPTVKAAFNDVLAFLETATE